MALAAHNMALAGYGTDAAALSGVPAASPHEVRLARAGLHRPMANARMTGSFDSTRYGPGISTCWHATAAAPIVSSGLAVLPALSPALRAGNDGPARRRMAGAFAAAFAASTSTGSLPAGSTVRGRRHGGGGGKLGFAIRLSRQGTRSTRRRRRCGDRRLRRHRSSAFLVLASGVDPITTDCEIVAAERAGASPASRRIRRQAYYELRGSGRPMPKDHRPRARPRLKIGLAGRRSSSVSGRRSSPAARSSAPRPRI
jgi:hypothetical protein